jgi:hypothetical protein
MTASGLVQPPARVNHGRVGDVVQRDDRLEAETSAMGDHRPISVAFGMRVAPRGRLDAGPLDAEPVAGEAEIGREPHVLGPQVIAVQCVSARFSENRDAEMFDRPVIAGDVIAVVLMR